jgi:hypothetical protein
MRQLIFPMSVGRTTAIRASTWRMELAWMLSASLVAVCAAAMPVFRNALFYFQDDFQIQFMPMFGEIARLIKSGEFPLMTDRIWFGGAILGEYQFAVFNPVSLVLYLAMDEIGRLHLAATLFVLAHIAILAGGLYLLARACGADRLASLLAAVVGSTSSWLIYWGAATWIPALVGTAWLPWAVWSLSKAYRDSRWVIPAALFSFMVLVSGWPYANVAVIVTLAIMLPILFVKERWAPACLRVVLAFGSALLLSAPALFPVIAYLQEGDRVQSLLWRPSLGDVLVSPGIPFFPTVLQVWSGEHQIVISPSTYYLSWFVPLVLVNAMTRSPFRRSTEQMMLWSACAAFALLCVSPALWQFRYPFRFLPYYHFALVLLVAMIVTKQSPCRGENRWRLWPSAAALLLPFYIAYSNAPEAWALQAMAALPIGLAASVVAWLQWKRVEWRGFLVASHILFFFFIAVVVPSNALVPDWRPPLERAGTEAQSAAGPRAFALYPPTRVSGEDFGGSEKLPRDYWASLAPGNTALYSRQQTVNGYSAFRQRSFLDLFCLDQKGGTCEDGPSRLLAVEPRTKLSYADLMAVDRVVAMRGAYSAMFAGHAGAEWTVAGRTELADIFERAAPRRRIGNIVQWPEAARIRTADAGTRSESYDIALEGAGGRIVVARAWYPGITARLNGREVPVEPIAGIVPSVVLPPGAQGTLTIEYWPAGLTLGLYAALAGLGVLAAFAVARRFRTKASAAEAVP